jgi:hypothetical protein
VRVTVGQRVMDHPSPALAAGLPFRFTGPNLPAALQRNGEHLTVTGPAHSTEILDGNRKPGGGSPNGQPAVPAKTTRSRWLARRKAQQAPWPAGGTAE